MHVVTRSARPVAIIALGLGLSACATTPPADVTADLCETMRPALPTFALEDTERTQREVASFWDLFTDDRICGA